MRLLSLAFLVVMMQSLMAQDVYDPQFQVVKSFKIVEVVENEDGVEREEVVVDEEVSNYTYDSFKNGDFEAISKEDIQRLLRSGKKPENKQPSKEPAKTEKPKTESPIVVQEQSTLDGVVKIVDKLIAVGQKIYKIVASGKPELTMASNPVSVVPMDDKGKVVAPFLLENWEVPKSKKFRVTIENYMGIDVVDFEFMVIFSYGGSFAGAGKYITSAQVKPTYVDVTWGFTFDVNCSLQSIMNSGTKENPVAGALLMIDYRVVSVLQERVVNKTFYIDGLGNLIVH